MSGTRPIDPVHSTTPGTMLAFLFTDIEGSTKLWESQSQPVMRGAIARHDALMRAAVERAGGHVFKMGGDAVFAVFPDAMSAVDGALACQRDLKADGFPEIGGLRVRMSIHVGSVEMRDGDYFGPPLNRVSRILSLAHGEQILVSGVAAALVHDSLSGGTTLEDMGRHKLKDIAEPVQVYQLQAPDLRSSFPPLRSASEFPNNLHPPVTSFVGRDVEIAEVAELVKKHRLVTITGSGGIGKTRTSEAVGHALLEQYPDGVWMLELAPISDPLLVAETLAGILGLSRAGNQSPEDAVVSFLKQKKTLLIFDNCEHLIVTVARLAETILQNCPEVSMLCASREQLSIPGETRYTLPALRVPALPERATASQALACSAVRLFVERAATVVNGFELTDEDAPAVAKICERLDGLPLAIELAAARIRALKPRELEARLADRFRILTGGNRTALPRQQTLRALIDWSYDLLSEQEMQLFNRLAVFQGGCTLDSATFVAAGEPVEDWEVMDLLVSLVDKSLLTVDSSGAETRYRMLESTRQYALEKLHDSGGGPERRLLLARFFAQFYADAEARWATAGTTDWLSAYAPDLDNLRSALEWALSPDGDVQLGLDLTSNCLRLMQELSLVMELERWFETAVSQIREDTPAQVKARLFFGKAQTLDMFACPPAAELARQAVALFREVDSPADIGMALARLGSALLDPEGGTEGEASLQEALSLLKPLGPTKHLATCINNMGCLHFFAGDVQAARQALEEAAAIARKIGDSSGLRMILNNVAEMAFAAGDAESAIASAQEVIAGAEANDDRKGLALTRMNLAAYLLSLDRIDEAREAARESLRDAQALKLSYYATILIEHLALIAAVTGDGERSARLLGYGSEWYRSNEKPRERTEQMTYEKTRKQLASALAEPELARLTREGAEWSEDRVMEEALLV